VSGFSPLLIELGTEELPVKALPGLAQAFFDGVLAALDKRGIACQRGDAKPLYTPRRLAVCLPGVAVEQPEQRSEVLGPYLNIALDAEGKPTKALEGFAAKSGIDWTALEKTTDNKGERFVLRSVKPGAKTADLLPEIVAEALAGMPIPKPMRWGERDSGFARPVHWLVLLLGDAVVDAEVFGAKADRMSRGHRFHHEGPVWISTPGDYVDALRAAKVLVDPEERRHRVVAEVDAAAARAGGTARRTDDNLEQVQCLVEWPKAVLCAFEREFLAVPQEALIATMEANQKFFPVLDAGGKLTEHFIGIANIESKDESEVRKGYERVIRPRFADAKFFFDEDLKQGLASMNEGLKTVTYQAKLGTVADKVARVAALAESIAGDVGVDPKLARRAAELAKADLQSRMVNEFPELQGIAGRYYAMHDASLNDLSADERKQLAGALDEVYMPRFAGDAVAPSKLGQVLAIAERLDTLMGCFKAQLEPTGNKDPFALRRAALGLVRTLCEGKLELNTFSLLERAEPIQPIVNPEVSAREVNSFVYQRLRSYFLDQGFTNPHFEYAARSAAQTLPDFELRIHAARASESMPETAALAAATKRSANILRKARAENESIPEAVDPNKLVEDAERALHAAVDQAIADTDPLLAHRDYVAVLARLARLRPEVDTFFDKVMVNVEDPAVRANRLALLQRLANRLGSVGAIEHLSV
jgi:glycyl-tRNA synthetase beta chain